MNVFDSDTQNSTILNLLQTNTTGAGDNLYVFQGGFDKCLVLTGSIVQLNPDGSAPSSIVSALSGSFDPAGAASAAVSYSVARVNHTGTQPASTISGLAQVAITGSYADLDGKPTLGALSSLDSIDLSTTKATGTLPDARLSSNVPLLNANNNFTAVQYITSGGLNVGSNTAPKGTGVSGSKIEIQATGTGGSAFPSVALAKTDVTSNSILGTLDFYLINTLAAQIQCIQQAGGPGGVNYLYFNLGSAGTMYNIMQLQYTNSTALGTLQIGYKNSTLQGNLSVYNYLSAGVTSGVTLCNPVSSGNNGGCGLTWVDTASTPNKIGMIRGHYMSSPGVGDVVLSVGTGTTNGLQDFVRLTSGNVMQFYGLSSTASRRQGFISSTWNVSTDATRIGQVNIGATGIISGSETDQTAITIIPSTSGPTTTITGGLTISSTGFSWNTYWGANFTSNVGVTNLCMQQEVVTGGGLPVNCLQYAKNTFSIGQVGRNTYTCWFAGGAGHANFGTIPIQGSPAIYARVRMDPDLMSSASAQTIALGATLYIGSAPSNATNLTITKSRALHVNSGECYFGGSFIIGSGNLHFNNGTPIARPTINPGTATASDIVNALISLGIFQ